MAKTNTNAAEAHVVKIVCETTEQAELLAKASLPTLLDGYAFAFRAHGAIAQAKSVEYVSKLAYASDKKTQDNSGPCGRPRLNPELATSEDKQFQKALSALEELRVAGWLTGHVAKLSGNLHVKQAEKIAELAAKAAATRDVNREMQMSNAANA